jgi:hypothetical protein
MPDTKASDFAPLGSIAAGDLFPVVTAALVNSIATYGTLTGQLDALYDALGVAAVVAGDLTTHAADTTAIHGIADTTKLTTIGKVAALPYMNLR